MKNIVLSIIVFILMLSHTPTALSYIYTIYNQTNDGTSPGGDIKIHLDTSLFDRESPYTIQIAPGQSGQIKTGLNCMDGIIVHGLSGSIKGRTSSWHPRTFMSFERCKDLSISVKHRNYAVMPQGSPERIKGGRVDIQVSGVEGDSVFLN